MPLINDETKSNAPPKVGYCQPPDHTRWKKGQSGNPAGRKWGSKNLKSDFEKAANMPVTIPYNGKQKKVTMIKALAAAPFLHAMKGDTKNAIYAAELLEKYNLTDTKNLPNDGDIIIDQDGMPVIVSWVPNDFDEKIDKLIKNIQYVAGQIGECDDEGAIEIDVGPDGSTGNDAD